MSKNQPVAAVVRPGRVAFVGRAILVALAVVTGCALSASATLAALHAHGFGWDSHAYWMAWRHPGGLYGPQPEHIDAYLYSPLFAQVLWPAALLPWAVFAGVWAGAAAGTFAWLLRPLPLRWQIVGWFLVLPEIFAGNVWWLFALVLVFGFARPGAWAIPALTKVTAGGVGLIWFAGRREWRRLAVAAATIAALTLVSFAVSPGLWFDWLRFLADGGDNYSTHGSGIPPLARIPVAAIGVWFAARRGRVGWLPGLVLLSSPVFSLSALAMLTALPRIYSTQPYARGTWGLRFARGRAQSRTGTHVGRLV